MLPARGIFELRLPAESLYFCGFFDSGGQAHIYNDMPRRAPGVAPTRVGPRSRRYGEVWLIAPGYFQWHRGLDRFQPMGLARRIENEGYFLNRLVHEKTLGEIRLVRIDDID